MPAKKSGTPHKPACNCAACARTKKALALPAGVIPGVSELSAEAAPRPVQVVKVGARPAPVPVIREEGALSAATLDGDAPDVIYEVPGFKLRDRIGQWMVLRQEDPSLSNAECAKRMGITSGTLSVYISRARKQGWLTFSNPFSRIEHEIIPQVLDNLSFYLSKEGGRDKQVTLETAKGTIFRTYLESQGVSEAPKTVLALKIETAPQADGTPIKIVSGNVVGQPRAIEGITLPEDK